MQPTIHLLWDIDGTLVGRSEAPIDAWKALATERFGRDFSWDDLDAGGSTDPLIAAGICDLFLEKAQYCDAEQLCLLYPALACENLAARPNPPLAASHRLFRQAEESEWCENFFLTGNYRSVAQAKLTFSGLGDFRLRGGFAEDGPDRALVARAAASEAMRLGPGRLVVVGDTPRDVAAARHVGAVSVVVCGGDASSEAVQKAGPDLLYAELPELETFLADLTPWVAAKGFRAA